MPDSQPIFNVKEEGALGDGRNDDTHAFQSAAAKLVAAHGGEIVIPAGRYVVGQHDSLSPLAARDILKVTGCSQDVFIHGDAECDSVLLAAPNMKYGAFDPVSLLPVDTSRIYQAGGTFVDPNYAASAYWGMIHLQANTGHVTVADLTLDGNIEQLDLGGDYSDPRFQLPASGVRAYSNSDLTIQRVTCRGHGLDGITLGWDNAVSQDGIRHFLSHVTCDENGRNGMSWAGGDIGLTAEYCSFNRSGRSHFTTSPGAGLDIEPDDPSVPCRSAVFFECEFAGNAAGGFEANIGDCPGQTASIDVIFKKCRFIGSPTGYAIYPYRPGIKFQSCVIYGWAIYGFGSPIEELATSFDHCYFEDRDFEGRPSRRGGALIEMYGENLLFTNCTVVARGTRALWLAGGHKALRHTKVTHGWDGLPEGDVNTSFQSLVENATLEDVAFLEDFDRPPVGGGGEWYIIADVASDSADVSVAGPHVTWRALGPGAPTGQVIP